MKQRGRPKGRSSDNRSFGPLGDLIRSRRIARGLGLSDLAKACQCSVQFVSNIEHGRAPLPWEKVGQLADVLRIPVSEIQAANLAIRSDFQSFMHLGNGAKAATTRAPEKLRGKMVGTVTAVAFAAKDSRLQEIIQRYQSASAQNRKKFVRAALEMLN